MNVKLPPLPTDLFICTLTRLDADAGDLAREGEALSDPVVVCSDAATALREVQRRVAADAGDLAALSEWKTKIVADPFGAAQLYEDERLADVTKVCWHLTKLPLTLPDTQEPQATYIKVYTYTLTDRDGNSEPKTAVHVAEFDSERAALRIQQELYELLPEDDADYEENAAKEALLNQWWALVQTDPLGATTFYDQHELYDYTGWHFDACAVDAELRPSRSVDVREQPLSNSHALQALRLLGELRAVGAWPTQGLGEVAESMDLTPEAVTALFEQCADFWDYLNETQAHTGTPGVRRALCDDVG